MTFFFNLFFKTLKVANPSPLGLFAFALTSLLMTGANTALTEDGPTQHRVACYGLMYGGLALFTMTLGEMALRRLKR